MYSLVWFGYLGLVGVGWFVVWRFVGGIGCGWFCCFVCVCVVWLVV